MQNFEKKTEFCDLVNLKLLLNRNELEKNLDIKKLRLIDIFPTTYNLNHFDQQFVKISRKTAAASHRQPHNF